MRLETAEFLHASQNVPGNGLNLRAFNLEVGMVIRPSTTPVYGEAAWVVVSVLRNHDTEKVQVSFYLHSLIITEEFYTESTFDFCREVFVVGFCVNPLDINDVDFGVK